MFINAVIGAIISFARSLYDKEDYHTSALSGAAWVLELLEDHPNQICCELGVNKHVFHYLISYLQLIGINHSQNITLEEQLAIFLYRCVTGRSDLLLIHLFTHALQVYQYAIQVNSFNVQMIQFQSVLLFIIKNYLYLFLVYFRYFLKMLYIFSSKPFYSDFICQP